MSTSGSIELFKPDRLLAFSDGVFGVAITLLVIDVHLPPLPPNADDGAMSRALLGMGQKLFVFSFTFIVIGMNWLAHHRKFSYIGKVDVPLLWMNLLYLLALCLVPFASGVLAEHGSSGFAFALYASVMTLTGVVSAGLSVYGLREPFLERGLAPGRENRWGMAFSSLAASMLFVIAAVVALGGLVRLAHWILILIIPATALLGSRTRIPAGARKS